MACSGSSESTATNIPTVIVDDVDGSSVIQRSTQWSMHMVSMKSISH